MENTAASPAETRRFRVSYVDIVVRETFIHATDEDHAYNIIEEQISNGTHHHAIDAYHEDIQAEVATVTLRPFCFECGR